MSTCTPSFVPSGGVVVTIQDAAELDTRYFTTYPGQFLYQRPATRGERRLFALPPGTQMLVLHLGTRRFVRYRLAADATLHLQGGAAHE